jgi:YggT family protein
MGEITPFCQAQLRDAFSCAARALRIGLRADFHLSRKCPMSELLTPLIIVINAAIEIFKMMVLASIVMGWLVSFDVINTRNRAVYVIMDVLYRVTEPALRPLRKIMPNTGALDLSPILLFFILWLIQMYLPMLVHGF